jgi:hypothetical protein
MEEEIPTPIEPSSDQKQKKVDFETEITEHNYQPLTSEEEQEEPEKPSSSQESSVSSSDENGSLASKPFTSDGYSMGNIKKLEEEEEMAFKEHKYLMTKLKKRQRAGNIFVDKI